MSDLFSVRIDERAARRVAAGYPWIFRSEVKNADKAAALAPGSVVDFVREKGDWAARGFYNPSAPQLVGRVLTLKAEQNIDRYFVVHQIESAFCYRESLFDKPFYRLIHAESDGLPGLIVDRYGDIVVCQINTAGMEVLLPHVQMALNATISPRVILLRNDTPARAQEGLGEDVRVLQGSLDAAPVTSIENDVSFQVDVEKGQKTGWFFDQRDNRAWVAGLSRGRSMIDVFCHTGGFGITAAKKGASAVTFVDSSSDALVAAEKNAEINGVGNICQYVEGKAFDIMEKLAHVGQRYEVVSVDPPAFIKSRKDMGAGLKGYQKLARLAAPLVERQGYLFFASCSHHASLEVLTENIADGLSKSGRSFQIIKTGGPGCDHPVHPRLPETGYLKSLTFRFLD